MRKHGVYIFTGGLPWQPAGIKFTQRKCWSKISIFAPAGKTMRWIEKWLTPFTIFTTFSISMQSLGEIELRAPIVRAKIGVLCLLRLVGMPARRRHSSKKFCGMVYVSILMRFSALFQNGLPFQVHYIVLIFIARRRHNFCEISVNIAKSQKFGGKCVRTTSYR